MGIILFILTTLVATILLLNLLIAMMSNVFEEVTKDVESQFIVDRAEVVFKIVAVTMGQWQQAVDDVFFQEDTGIPGILFPIQISTDEFQKVRL
jgi:hypothetical protein